MKKAPGAATAGVFGADGTVDLIVAGIDDPSVTLLRGDGHGGFTPTQPLILAAATGGLSAVVTADVNGDGKLDVVASNPTTGRVVVILGDGQFGLREASATAVGSAPGRTVVADITGDGLADLIVAEQAGVTLLQGTGDGHFTLLSRVDTGAPVSDLAVLDVTGDGQLDLLVALPSLNVVRLYTGDGAGNFTAGARLAGNTPSVFVVGDFTGDGRPDLVVATTGDQTLTLFAGTGTGFEAGHSVTSGVVATRLARTDVDGDGRADLVALDSTGHTLHTLLGNGDGTFRALPPQDLGMAPSQDLVVVDLNGDHLPDVVVSVPVADGLLIGANPARTPVLPGDLDRNGLVTPSDLAQLIHEFFDGDGADAASTAGGTVNSGAQADANGDGVITAADVVNLLHRLAR